MASVWPALARVDVAAADGEVGVPVEVEVEVPVLAKTYSSPVESELTNMRPFESSARPTGLKQSSGHFEVSEFMNISVVAVKLSEAATGDPALKAMDETL